MEKKKTITIILITFLTLIAGLILVLMFFIIKEEKNSISFMEDEKKKIIYEKNYALSDIKELKINSRRSDIEIKNTKEEQIKVIIYGSTKEKATSYIKNNILNISKNIEKRICFGLCLHEEDKIVVYLPKQIKSTLEIQNQSGDIIIEKLPNLELKINNTSGNIEIEKVNKSNITTISGDILLNETSIATLRSKSGEIEIKQISDFANIETTSGDIEVMNFNMLRNSSMKTTSGNITILSINDIAILSHTKSGDLRIKESNKEAKSILKVYTTSGNITIR